MFVRSSRPSFSLGVAIVALTVVPLMAAGPDPTLVEHTSAAAPEASQRQSADLAKVDQALFRIEADGSMGSGFLYRSSGYVLTNRHVVDEVPIGGSLRVRPVKTGADGAVTVGEPMGATLRFKHTELDVAVIEIPVRATQVTLDPSDSVERAHAPRGLELWAHGFPDVGSPTISRGMLSAHFEDPITGEILYLTDTALAPGSSGGPVTDASGGVVGIATAVHIVEGGAGTSWGYVLPIRSVEKALSCAKGFQALPKPFDAAKWRSEVRDAPTPLKSMQRYAEGVKEATSRCASPGELTDALLSLDAALAAAGRALDPEDSQPFIRLLIETSTAIDARFFEFDLLGESDGALRARRRYSTESALASDADSILGKFIGDLESKEGLVRFGRFLGDYATELMKLVATSEAACSDIKAAWAAVEDDGPARRADVRRYARAISSMIQALNAVKSLDPSQIEPNDPELPSELRQSLRLSKATLENLLDRWSGIASECRDFVADLNETLAGRDDASEDEADRGDSRTASQDLDFEAFLEEWSDAGWSRWGATQRNTASGKGHIFNIDFDESPAIVYMVVHAKGSRGFDITVRDGRERELELLDEGAEDGRVGIAAVEATKDGKLSFDFDSKNLRNFPFEFAVLYRPTQLGRMRESAEKLGSYPEEIGPRTFFISPREKKSFTFTADEWAAFLIVANEGMGKDIDLRILDPEGKVVASDVEADSLPIGEVERAVRGSYSLEIINATDRFVTVDTLLVARRRAR